VRYLVSGSASRALWIICNCMRELFFALLAAIGEIIASQRDNGLTASSIAFYVHQRYSGQKFTGLEVSWACFYSCVPASALSCPVFFAFFEFFNLLQFFRYVSSMMRLFFAFLSPKLPAFWGAESDAFSSQPRSHLNLTPTPPFNTCGHAMHLTTRVHAPLYAMRMHVPLLGTRP
jgi:hypothetical protein